MKIFISVDIEGVCGVVNSDSTGPGGKTYNDACLQMTEEVNAAVSGALAAGATEIIVNDSHGGMNNLQLGRLHRAVEVIIGTPKPLMMMQGIDSKVHACMFVGYHSRMHARGILSHTISGGVVSNVWVNDVLCGEIGINAGIAGHFGVPVVLVTGDQEAALEAKGLVASVETAVVKEAVTRFSAKNLHPTAAQELIHSKALQALSQQPLPKPLVFTTPVTMRIEFLHAGMADAASFLPASVRVSGSTIEYSASDYITAFQGLRTMITLASK